MINSASSTSSVNSASATHIMTTGPKSTTSSTHSAGMPTTAGSQAGNGAAHASASHNVEASRGNVPQYVKEYLDDMYDSTAAYRDNANGDTTAYAASLPHGVVSVYAHTHTIFTWQAIDVYNHIYNISVPDFPPSTTPQAQMLHATEQSTAAPMHTAPVPSQNSPVPPTASLTVPPQNAETLPCSSPVSPASPASPAASVRPAHKVAISQNENVTQTMPQTVHNTETVNVAQQHKRATSTDHDTKKEDNPVEKSQEARGSAAGLGTIPQRQSTSYRDVVKSNDAVKDSGQHNAPTSQTESAEEQVIGTETQERWHVVKKGKNDAKTKGGEYTQESNPQEEACAPQEVENEMVSAEVNDGTRVDKDDDIKLKSEEEIELSSVKSNHKKTCGSTKKKRKIKKEKERTKEYTSIDDKKLIDEHKKLIDEQIIAEQEEPRVRGAVFSNHDEGWLGVHNAAQNVIHGSNLNGVVQKDANISKQENSMIHMLSKHNDDLAYTVRVHVDAKRYMTYLHGVLVSAGTHNPQNHSQHHLLHPNSRFMRSKIKKECKECDALGKSLVRLASLVVVPFQPHETSSGHSARDLFKNAIPYDDRSYVMRYKGETPMRLSLFANFEHLYSVHYLGIGCGEIARILTDLNNSVSSILTNYVHTYEYTMFNRYNVVLSKKTTPNSKGCHNELQLDALVAKSRRKDGVCKEVCSKSISYKCGIETVFDMYMLLGENLCPHYTAETYTESFGKGLLERMCRNTCRIFGVFGIADEYSYPLCKNTFGKDIFDVSEICRNGNPLIDFYKIDDIQSYDCATPSSCSHKVIVPMAAAGDIINTVFDKLKVGDQLSKEEKEKFFHNALETMTVETLPYWQSVCEETIKDRAELAILALKFAFLNRSVLSEYMKIVDKRYGAETKSGQLSWFIHFLQAQNMQKVDAAVTKASRESEEQKTAEQRADELNRAIIGYLPTPMARAMFAVVLATFLRRIFYMCIAERKNKRTL